MSDKLGTLVVVAEPEQFRAGRYQLLGMTFADFEAKNKAYAIAHNDWVKNIGPAYAKVTVGECCVILYHAAAFCFYAEVGIPVMKLRQLKVIRRLFNKAEVQAHVYIIVAEAEGRFFVF